MSNSPLVTYTRISSKKTSPRKHAIDTITIHCIVGQWTAKQGCDYFATTDRNSSVNYVVGKDGSIGLCVDEKDRAWTSGGTDKNGNPIRVNGISGSDNDHRAITIEVASDTTHPYAVTDKAYESLIKLVADICKRNGIKQLRWRANKNLVGNIAQQNMTVHRWFANKACPGDYLYERHGDIADKVNAILGTANVPTVSTPSEEPKVSLKVGDVVNFTGTTHYVSSSSTKGSACKPGKAKVTALARTGKHTAHLVAIAGGGSNVYGWVDTAFIACESANLAVGTKVKVNAGAKTYTGGSLKSFVYSNTYEVISVSGDRVVIGVDKVVTAAINKKDLTIV